ncbi:MAG: XdhC/CoxI family protein [Pseudomonadota bacterium]
MKKEIWSFLLPRKRVALLTVVDARGETPGRTGFKMAVSSDGSLFGTIGGGKVEHDLVEEARALLRSRTPRSVVRRKVHRLESDQKSGMICGGEQTMAICPIRAADRTALKSLAKSAQNGTGGTLRLSADRISFRRSGGGQERRRFTSRGTKWSYEERIPAPEKIFIVGGGHVGLALSKVMATLGFHVVVLDERPTVGTLIENDCAHEKRIVSFRKIGKEIPSGDRHYVAIMTPGHAADETVLRQLIRKKFRYLGLMGSRRKVFEVSKNLLSEGYPRALIDRVRMPIGLPIGSQTPGEIAVSIAAEIIQTRKG